MAGRCFFIYTKEKAPLISEALFHGEGEKMKKSNFRIAKAVNNGDNIIYKPCDEGATGDYPLLQVNYITL